MLQVEGRVWLVMLVELERGGGDGGGGGGGGGGGSGGGCGMKSSQE